jgi:hypothetical protein
VVDEVFRRRHVLRVSALGISARCSELTAEVFVSTQAGTASSARRINPGDPHPIAGCEPHGLLAALFDGADDLVTENDRQMRRGSSFFNFVQFGVADSTGRDADKYFMVPGDGIRESH